MAIDNLSARTGEIAARFYDEPSAAMTMIGVTGTNGKTSCTQFIAQALSAMQRKCGLIGTIGYGLYGDLQESAYTTPDPVFLQSLLAQMRLQGADTVAMEVSSQGLHQNRVNGVRFDVAVFTNLTRDHLDYHGSMEAYAETKAIAEEVALKAASEQLKVCALRPHLIWGPGDNHLFPRVLARARAGKLRIVGDGENQVDVTHVDTAADAHLGALDALLAGRANGKAYFLSQGEPVKLWVFINRLLVGAGEKPITKRISQRAAYWLGALLEGAWTLFRLKGEPPMTRFVAVELAKDHWFDVSAARRDLGLKPAVETWAELDRLAATLRTK
jgi:hypothetical protein